MFDAEKPLMRARCLEPLLVALDAVFDASNCICFQDHFERIKQPIRSTSKFRERVNLPETIVSPAA
jgi:hypothetical protein